MTDQAEVISDALGRLSDRSVTADDISNRRTEAARVMADAWPLAVDTCLSAHPWRWASYLVEIHYEGYGVPSDDPHAYAAPGFSYAYAVPADHLRTNWIRAIADQLAPAIPFHMQDKFWHTNTASLFCSYVSHQHRNVELWIPSFANVVSSYLAWRKGSRLRPAADSDTLRKNYEADLDIAKVIDSSETPQSGRPVGRLARSRFSRGQIGSFSREQG